MGAKISLFLLGFAFRQHGGEGGGANEILKDQNALVIKNGAASDAKPGLGKRMSVEVDNVFDAHHV